MGLYLLNISVDSDDPAPEHVPEDLSVNDQESIIELLVEKVLGFEGAIEEYDDFDTEDHTTKNNTKIELILDFYCLDKLAIKESDVKRRHYPNYVPLESTGFNQTNSPPPEI